MKRPANYDKYDIYIRKLVKAKVRFFTQPGIRLTNAKVPDMAMTQGMVDVLDEFIKSTLHILSQQGGIVCHYANRKTLGAKVRLFCAIVQSV
jgi:hypothetical protein